MLFQHRVSLSIWLVLLPVLLLFTPQPGSAQDTDTQAAVDQITKGVVDVSRRMYDIVLQIETVEDVATFRGEIANLFEEMATTMREGLTSPVIAAEMQGILNDPELLRWNQKFNDRLALLNSSSPETVKHLQQVIEAESVRVVQVVQEAMKMQMEWMREEELFGNGVRADQFEEDRESFCRESL